MNAVFRAPAVVWPLRQQIGIALDALGLRNTVLFAPVLANRVGAASERRKLRQLPMGIVAVGPQANQRCDNQDRRQMVKGEEKKAPQPTVLARCSLVPRGWLWTSVTGLFNCCGSHRNNPDAHAKRREIVQREKCGGSNQLPRPKKLHLPTSKRSTDRKRSEAGQETIKSIRPDGKGGGVAAALIRHAIGQAPTPVPIRELDRSKRSLWRRYPTKQVPPASQPGSSQAANRCKYRGTQGCTCTVPPIAARGHNRASTT